MSVDCAAQDPGAGNRASGGGAADLLKRKARSHRGLDDELSWSCESTTRHAGAGAARISPQQYEGDRAALALLSETLAEIDARVPTLILLPESRLIDSLIAALEESHAENRLGEDEDRLLARLRGLKKDLEAMDWSDEAAWGRLVHKIDRLNEAGPTARRAGHPNRRRRHKVALSAD